MGTWNFRSWMGKLFGQGGERPEIEHLLPELPDQGFEEHETWSLLKYTPGARQLIGRAQTLADEAHHPQVTPLHLARKFLDLEAVQNVIRRNGAHLHQCKAGLRPGAERARSRCRAGVLESRACHGPTTRRTKGCRVRQCDDREYHRNARRWLGSETRAATCPLRNANTK
jgi:hypothetical protein